MAFFNNKSFKEYPVILSNTKNHQPANQHRFSAGQGLYFLSANGCSLSTSARLFLCVCFTLSALPWSVCTEQAGGQTPAQRVLFYSWRVIPALHLLNLLPWSVCPEFSPTPPPLTLALSSSDFRSNSDFSTMQNQISWFLISIAPYFLLVYIFLETRG